MRYRPTFAPLGFAGSLPRMPMKETMLVVNHPDGEPVMLTWYCVVALANLLPDFSAADVVARHRAENPKGRALSEQQAVSALASLEALGLVERVPETTMTDDAILQIARGLMTVEDAESVLAFAHALLAEQARLEACVRIIARDVARLPMKITLGVELRVEGVGTAFVRIGGRELATTSRSFVQVASVMGLQEPAP